MKSVLFSSLTSVFNDWNDFLYNPQYTQDDTKIFWPKFSPRILADPVMTSHVGQLIENGQYTFRISEDDSLIQILYTFANTKKDSQVKTAMLAFYQYSLEERSANWLRIDLDPQRESGVLHAKSHLHLSSFPETRFVMDGVPNPKQFVEFIAASFYPEVYKSHRLNANGDYLDKDKIQLVNLPSINIKAPNKTYDSITHWHIPR